MSVLPAYRIGNPLSGPYGLSFEEAIRIANKVALRTGVRQRISRCMDCADDRHYIVRPVDYDREWA